MAKGSGQQVISMLQKQIRLYGLVSGALLALAFSILITSTIYRFALFPFPPSLAIAAAVAAVSLSLYASRKVTERDVARYLNQQFPQLQESAELVLRSPESMNSLEKLQAVRIGQELEALPGPIGTDRKLKTSAFILGIALLISFAISKIPACFVRQQPAHINKSSAPEKILPEIRDVTVIVAPPAYTGQPAREQSRFSIIAEDGASITWKLKTSVPVKSFKLIFNTKQEIEMRSLNAGRTEWSLVKTISASGFYQVSLDGKLSDFYTLETIKDQPAAIRIISPKQYSTIDFGQPQQVRLIIALADDHGIRDSYISATVASGQGEGVKFKEQKLLFGRAFGGKDYKLKKLIDLKALGMQPGDELYFYIKALDNHGQESRSDVYFASIQDTAQLMSMEGMTSGVSLVPEYFRSQRQIIIDTEKLLRDKDSISTESFNSRSNNLGIDQKMLRLRYGKFLGEEDESDAVGHEEGNPNEPVILGDASSIMDQYTHKHDQAEDATFFEPELKNQLKATLTEMWDSELRLRTYKPREALPYEYKALKLLKDLQQKSRVYVAKTSAKTPVLNLEKRLTGELDKIGNPVVEREAIKSQSRTEVLRKGISILENLKAGIQPDNADVRILQEANQEILQNALKQPAVYLNAVSAMRKILSSHQKPAIPYIAIAETALQKIIAPAARLPQAGEKPSGTTLSGHYFKNLTRQRQ